MEISQTQERNQTMSLKTRDIEELFRRHGPERGAQKAIMLLTETVVAQQEALLEAAKTLDVYANTMDAVLAVQGAQVSEVEKMRKKLGLDIDEGGVASEPIQDFGKKEH